MSTPVTVTVTQLDNATAEYPAPGYEVEVEGVGIRYVGASKAPFDEFQQACFALAYRCLTVPA